MRANVGQTGAWMQAGVLPAVHAGADALGLGPESGIVSRMDQMEHLVLERVVNIAGKLLMVGARETDHAVTVIARAGNAHPGRPTNLSRGQLGREERRVQGCKALLQLRFIGKRSGNTGEQVSLRHDWWEHNRRLCQLPSPHPPPPHGRAALPPPTVVANGDSCRTNWSERHCGQVSVAAAFWERINSSKRWPHWAH